MSLDFIIKNNININKQIYVYLIQLFKYLLSKIFLNNIWKLKKIQKIQVNILFYYRSLRTQKGGAIMLLFSITSSKSGGQYRTRTCDPLRVKQPC